MLKMNCSAHILCRPINKSNEREDIGWNMKIRSENTNFFFLQNWRVSFSDLNHS